MSYRTWAEYQDAIRDTQCVYCDTNLTGERIESYPHGDGWMVDGEVGPLWLYITCPNCEYQNALWKLGVAR